MRNATTVAMSSISLNILQLLLPDSNNDQRVCNDEEDVYYSNQSMMQLLAPIEYAEMVTNDRWN